MALLGSHKTISRVPSSPPGNWFGKVHDWWKAEVEHSWQEVAREGDLQEAVTSVHTEGTKSGEHKTGRNATEVSLDYWATLARQRWWPSVFYKFIKCQGWENVALVSGKQSSSFVVTAHRSCGPLPPPKLAVWGKLCVWGKLPSGDGDLQSNVKRLWLLPCGGAVCLTSLSTDSTLWWLGNVCGFGKCMCTRGCCFSEGCWKGTWRELLRQEDGELPQTGSWSSGLGGTAQPLPSATVRSWLPKGSCGIVFLCLPI